MERFFEYLIVGLSCSFVTFLFAGSSIYNAGKNEGIKIGAFHTECKHKGGEVMKETLCVKNNEIVINGEKK